MVLSTLKVKQPIILPEKWVYLGIAEELQFGTHKLWQTIGKSGDQRKGTLLGREKEEVGRGYFKGKKAHWRKVRVQGGDSVSLAELWYFLIG